MKDVMPSSRNKYIEEIVYSFINLRKGLIGRADGRMPILPHSQGDVLMCLYHKEGMTTGDLSKKLNITPGAVSQLVDALVASEYIERTVDSQDKRVVKLSISKNGHSVLKRSKSNKIKQLSSLLKVLSDSEVGELAQILNKISKSVQEK